MLPEGTRVRIGGKHAREYGYDDRVGKFGTVLKSYRNFLGEVGYQVKVDKDRFSHWNIEEVDCIPLLENNESQSFRLRRENL